MKILVLNCGSSSIKYQLIEMNNEANVLAKGLVERIGLQMGEFTHRPTGKDKYYIQTPMPDHEVGINAVLEALTHPEHGVISDVNEIKACGHRVAHGGEHFPVSALVTEDAKKKINELCKLAPLHNPANLQGILVMEKLLPGVPQVAVFDTSFHQTMPPEAYLYAVPYDYYQVHKVRRYGFHGTSHKFVAPKAADFLGKDWKNMKIITCHLGNGASIAAIKNGQSVDTSMGFTPVEGLMMGTRTGDLDLGALLYIAELEKLDYAGMNNLVNKRSGLCGISGVGSDMRDIGTAAEEGNQRAQYALDMFAYKVKKYIGAYAAAMDGVDLIVFTGGIGENDCNTRERICKDLKFFGVDFDEKKNENLRGTDAILTKEGSKTTVMVVTTDEEYVIARDTYELVK
ncbi:MAG: acetate kinase [Bacteroidales bacterium]|jgi:acetate kinase|nr:acetate kinase [Bacteroidales bacterium]